MTATVDRVFAAHRGAGSSAADVVRARQRLGERIRHTPVMHSGWLDRAVGCSLWLKLEGLQHTGSFKLRGALNALLAVGPERLRCGVVAGSSGNHARAVALAAEMLGTDAVVVMPSDSPDGKRIAVERLGARIYPYDRRAEDRDRIVTKIATGEDRIIVPSSNSRLVIAGAGTVAAELLEQVEGLAVLVVPVGGGGLAAGCALVAGARRPAVAVIGVEPVGADDTLRSMRAGRRITIPPPETAADGLRHRRPEAHTFAINRRLLHRVVLVTEAEIDAATAALRCLGVIAEPSGACALAAVLAGRVPAHRGARVGVVVSGSNAGCA